MGCTSVYESAILGVVAPVFRWQINFAGVAKRKSPYLVIKNTCVIVDVKI